MHKILDATFITTHPDHIYFHLNRSFYIPNPCDESFEYLDNSKTKPEKDLFFAMSHGVHRGVFKEGKLYDGVYTEWNEKGIITLQGDYKEWGKEGIWRGYDDYGYKIFEELYQNGELIETKLF